MSQPAFDFGQNWKEFSDSALDLKHYAQAQIHFEQLLRCVPLTGRSFLDIGFGQGLSLLCAYRAGAKIHGLDINPKCRDVFFANMTRLEPDTMIDAKIAVGSVLDSASLQEVRSWKPQGFDVVHSWGVLHHTGHMWQAIDNAATLVTPGGQLVLAIYNRHFTSPAWTVIKWAYASSPTIIQKFLTWIFVPIIYLAKLAATHRNPLQMERGMDFYYNVVDWIGGYPYEYASRAEIEAHLTRKGFAVTHVAPAIVPTGCNEFVFRRL